MQSRASAALHDSEQQWSRCETREPVGHTTGSGQHFKQQAAKQYIAYQVAGIQDKNEKAMNGKDNLDEVLDRLRQAGYIVGTATLCPSQMKIPQTRLRVYLLGVHQASYTEKMQLQGTDEERRQHIQDIVDAWVECVDDLATEESWPCVPLSAFLMHSDHDGMHELERSVTAKIGLKTRGGEKWKARHMSLYGKKDVAWSCPSTRCGQYSGNIYQCVEWMFRRSWCVLRFPSCFYLFFKIVRPFSFCHDGRQGTKGRASRNR